MNEPAPTPGRVPELDGLRGIAIALVLYEHFVGRSVTGTGWLADCLRDLRFIGTSGVDLFFVLSGFLIGGILLDHRRQANYFKAFYIRRVCRILPPYYSVLAAYLVFQWVFAAAADQKWFRDLFVQGGMPFWAYPIFAQNAVKALTYHVNADWLIATWSLVVEEQFYLLLPLLLWLFRPRTVMAAVLALIVLIPAVQLWLRIFHTISYEVVANIWPIRGHGLLLGLLCAYGMRRERVRNWLMRSRGALCAGGSLLFLGMLYLIPRYSLGAFAYERILFYDTWVGLFYAALLLVIVTKPDGWLGGGLRWGWLRRLGVISYGVYLFHMPVNALLHGVCLGKGIDYQGPPDLVVTAAAFVVTLVLALASWHLVEKPIIGWGHFFTYGRPKASPATL